MAKNQDKLKELLRNVLPLLEEFVGEGVIEEDEPFGRSDQDIEIEVFDDGYSEDVELDEEEMDKEANKLLDEDVEEDDKELRKKISAAAISKKLGKDKKRK